MELVEGESLDTIIASGGLPLLRFFEITFHLAESFGLAGDTDRALDVLEQAVDQGFYPYPFMAEHCPFLAKLRPLPRFAGILAKAKDRADSFRKSENEH